MTLATPEPTTYDGVTDLVRRLRASRLPPPEERRAIRQRAEVSLEDAAAAIGVQKMTLSRWERGARRPQTPQLRAAYICLLQALTEVAREAAPAPGVDQPQK